MTEILQPKIKYIGEKYKKGYLNKICIDFSKQKIRGTVEILAENNHPNISKKNQLSVVWFDFAEIGRNLEVKND